MARTDLTMPSLFDLLNLDEAGFRKTFSASPVKRTGYRRFIRNVLIASGNSGDSSLIPVIKPYLDDTDIIILASAIWALSQLMPAAEFRTLAAIYENNLSHQDVLDEWDSGMIICNNPADNI